MYSTKYCEVHYEENYNVVFVKWKKFCCFDDYRKPLEYALDIIKNHSNCKKDELEGQESDSSDKIEFRHIYSLNEINN